MLLSRKVVVRLNCPGHAVTSPSDQHMTCWQRDTCLETNEKETQMQSIISLFLAPSIFQTAYPKGVAGHTHT